MKTLLPAKLRMRILELIPGIGTKLRKASVTVGPGVTGLHCFVLLSAVLAGLVLAAACGDNSTTTLPPEPVPPQATVVTVTPEAVSLAALDDTVRLSARVLDQNGQIMADVTVTWSSSAPSVATVDASGLVTAAGNGSASVAATSGAVSGSAAVTVAQAVAEVAVNPAADTLVAGDTLRLAASATDVNGHTVEGASFAWASEDTTVARVDDTGLVTGIAPGRMAVTATSGGVTGGAQLMVLAPMAAVSVTPEEASLTALGDTVRLSAEVRDESGSVLPDVETAWSSADTMVATVDSAGLVSAAGVGETKVTAVAGEVSGEARVSVTQATRSVAVSPAADTIVQGDTLRLSAEASDANGYPVMGSEFSWSSSDVSVATVDPSGLVQGLSEGTTTITAMADHVQGSSEITVAKPDRAALEALYHATNGPAWTNKHHWLTNTPLGRWHGVETNDDGRVTRVILPGNLLAGSLPPELGHLSYLETLNLRENRLTGALPPEIGRATRLREIDLGYTQLDGTIPATLGRLVDLRRLNFEYAEFSGPIPPELGALTELGFLNLYQNRLSGQLPAELAGLRSLRTAYLDENRLTGSIPSTFTQLENIETFYWGGNEGLCAPGTTDFETWRGERDMQGPRCNEGDRDALERFYHATDGANWTRSTGWLESATPEQWHGIETDSLGQVTLLDLSNNGLQGSLPPSVAELDRLSVLRIGENALSGRIPQALVGLSLEEFRYGDTELCVPRSIAFQKWLAAIAVREGTDEQCAPLSVRETLEVLYDATGGEEWWRRDNWLSDAPLGRWYGVTTDGGGDVVELALYGNNLRGRVPPELGGLASLRLLDLSFNWLSGRVPPDLGYVGTLEEIYLESNLLTGPIPAELGALPALTSLYLHDNRLDGAIPPELGDLSTVIVIWMDENQLEGEIPPELSNLSSVRFLYAGYNKLSGAIPPELGNLRSITDFALDGNNLSGPIPPELGNIASLTGALNLRENNLSGEIPAELGNLVSLEQLRLGSNNLSGPVPSALGRMRRLQWLDLSYNPELAGPLPSTFANLRELTRFEGAGTRLCVANDSPLADPAAARRFRMPLCDPPAARSSAYLVQAIQSASYPVPLVAGKDALLRVFPISPQSTEAHIPPARATFFVRGTEVHAVDVPGRPMPIPTELAEAEASLDRSANVRVPASVVRPGLEMVVDIDPAGVLDPGLGVVRRIPETGRMPVLVEAMPTFDLTLVPFIWQSRPDSTAVHLVAEMARDPKGHRLLSETRTMLPVADIAVTAHPPVRTSANDSDALLDEVTAIRALEGGTGYFMAALSGEATGSWGVAWIDGWTSYVRLGIVDQAEEALTVAHELGHNMSLYHAPCGVSSVVDRAYPYPDGQTGSWGLDVRSGSDVLVPPTWTDLMSYCTPAWVSEYNFHLAMSHRLKREAAADRSAASRPALLVWGGTDGEGSPYLNPAFAVDAPPSVPTRGGEHTVLGRAADGAVLFSFSFDMRPMADAEGQAGFAYTIPSSPEWVGALAEIELTGPAGSATIDETTNRPAVILRDPTTGHVRAILRDESAIETAAEAAGGAPHLRMPGPDLEVLFSRGLPHAVAPPPRR